MKTINRRKTEKERRREALQKAIKACNGILQMARDLGIAHQNIQSWLNKNGVPSDWVLKVEAVSGVSRHELRSDVFGEQ